jgi:hypothetical protein|tara:strand:- start:3353 stop:3691 length:339 start_codon:yes stop_codon:yes gene_type:complete
MSNPDPIENTVEFNKRNLRHFIIGLERLRREAEINFTKGPSDDELEAVEADWEGLVDTIIYNLSHSGHQSLAAMMDEWLSNHISISLGEKLEPLGNCTEVPFPHGHNDSMGG